MSDPRVTASGDTAIDELPVVRKAAQMDLWALPLFDDQKPILLEQSNFNESGLEPATSDVTD